MAGIGFSLKRLFSKKGLINLCKAYGYAGIVTTGPMLLGIALLLCISFVARLGGLSDHDRQLLNCLLTYSLLASLLISSWFNMVQTRYISDMLYQEREDKIMPSFWGGAIIQLVSCFFLYGAFLLYAGITPMQRVLCLWFAMTLILVWLQMIYMTALKDYRSIVLSFVICLMIGFLIALIFVLLGIANVETLLFSMILAYGLLAVWNLKLLLDYFPRSNGSSFSFLRWFDRYRSLAVIGGMIGIGLYSHLLIMYFGPLRVRITRGLFSAPDYDLAALFAFLTILITVIGFVTSMEVNFYPHYSNYYGLFNQRGSIRDIKLAEQEMRDVLRREITYLGIKQLFTTIICIVIIPEILSLLIPGMTSLSLAIFRILCASYAAYSLANSMMLISLYFEDYAGAMYSAIAFALISSILTILQILYGDSRYYGFGFFAGAIVFFFLILFRLGWYTQKLPYFLLSRQSLVPEPERGLFAAIARILDDRQNRIERKKMKEEADT